jgi:alpha-2-macroglobulin
VIVLYEGNYYSEVADLEVRAGGLNHHRLAQPQVRAEALFIQKMDSLIQDNPIIDNYTRDVGDIDKNRMASWYTTQYQPGTPPAGFTRKITGLVYSKLDNLPLPGTNVMVKGTIYGTVTDVNGEYTLYVPEEGAILLINFVGFVPFEGHSSEADRVKLEEDVKMLQELVVVAYGVQTQKRNLSASVVSIENSLQGRVAGVQIRGNSSVIRTPRFRLGGGGGEGFDDEPLYIIDGVPGSAAGLLNPDDIVSMEVLKGEAATAIYGSRASAGVIIITTSKGGSLLKPQRGLEGWGLEEGESMEAMNSLRTQFRDYAFWQPTLRTDKEGRARFEVTFPDDITGWNLYAIGMGPNRQTGTSTAFTQSYKPLMAQLNLPRFMVQGDSALAIGKTVNYSGDTLQVSRQFTVQDTPHPLGTMPVADARVDSLWFTATTDSLMLAYRLDMGSYFDGEQRKIPVFPQGVEETKGVFMVLDSDTTVRVPFEPGLGQGTLYLQADVLSVWMEEAEKLSRYLYNCNEQMASKLIGFLIQQEIKAFKNQPFDHQKDLQKLIKNLEDNQNTDGSWAWFNKGEGSLWISLHTAKALEMAREKGYKVTYNREAWVEFLWRHILDTERSHQRLMVLEALKEDGDKFGLKELVVDLVLKKQADEDRKRPWSLHDRLLLAHLQHKAGLTPDTLWMNSHRQETYFGGVFYGEKRYDMVVNEVSTTLAAYRFLVDYLPTHPDIPRIRQYFLETKGPRGWTNTYRSAQILGTLLPDLLREKATYRPSRVQVEGQASWINEFPHRMEVDGTTDIVLKKEGNMPLFVTGYQQFWNSEPMPVDKDFVVKTSFSTGSTLLEAGKPVQLKVEVKVLKYGEYVMIEVPIPAGCSYGDKPQSRANREVHREYFLEKTSLFCSSLSPGTYTFTIELLPRYTGTYTLNPAKAELMYFPVFYGRNGLRTVKVK